MSTPVGPLPRTIRTSATALFGRRRFQFLGVGSAVVLCCCCQLSAEDNALKADLERAVVGKTVVSKLMFGGKARPRGRIATYRIDTLFYPDTNKVTYRAQGTLRPTDVEPAEMKQRFDEGTSFRVAKIELKDDRLELKLETETDGYARLDLMLGPAWQLNLDVASVQKQLALVFALDQRPGPQHQETATQPPERQAEMSAQPSNSDTTIGQQDQQDAGVNRQDATALEAQYRMCAKHYIPADKCTPDIYRQLKDKDNAALAAREKLPADSGMYYQHGGNYSPMKMDCNSGLKSTGLSFGLRDKFIYKGISGPMQLDDHHPIFVFISPADTSALRSTFVLVQMNMKRDHRETGFAVGGVLNNLVEVKVTHEASDITITPLVDLGSGEYLLGMYQGANDATVGDLLGCGYDFSVK